MAAADDFTRGLLRQLRAEGQLTKEDGGIDETTAELLLRTPPTRELAVVGGDATQGGILGASMGRGGQPATSAATTVQHYTGSDMDSIPIAEIVGRIEIDCVRFHPNLAASMKLASEQMHRSLLQLFEDVVRDKIVDLISKKMYVTTALAGRNAAASLASSAQRSAVGDSPLPGGLNSFVSVSDTPSKALMPSFGGVGSGANAVVSRRPLDKGLERRDRALTAFVLPDQLREDLSNDINMIVENELRRCVGTIGSDVDKIFRTIQEAKGRMCRIEEEILQRQVEGRMQAEQLISQEEQIKSLTGEVQTLEEHHAHKDTQMDILREQVLRRNQTLDESRVRFRREVLRYKQRLFELETELEAHVNAKTRRRTSTAIMNDINALSTPSSFLEEDSAMEEELTAAAESAVKECTAQLEEQHRRREVQLQREKKALQTEMALKLSERDSEILRLKDKLQAALGSH